MFIERCDSGSAAKGLLLCQIFVSLFLALEATVTAIGTDDTDILRQVIGLLENEQPAALDIQVDPRLRLLSRNEFALRNGREPMTRIYDLSHNLSLPAPTTGNCPAPAFRPKNLTDCSTFRRKQDRVFFRQEVSRMNDV